MVLEYVGSTGYISLLTEIVFTHWLLCPQIERRVVLYWKVSEYCKCQSLIHLESDIGVARCMVVYNKSSPNWSRQLIKAYPSNFHAVVDMRTLQWRSRSPMLIQKALLWWFYWQSCLTKLPICLLSTNRRIYIAHLSNLVSVRNGFAVSTLFTANVKDICGLLKIWKQRARR